jgi:hypothetical protein
VLDRLLGRAQRLPASAGTLEVMLLERFGLSPDTGTAPYALKADDPGFDAEGWWLHADPVHLRADLDQLRLFDSRHLGIDPAEAAALAEAFNAHFASDGLRLHTPRPERWYLQVQEPPTIATHPLSEVAGRAIDPFLPTGDDARRWGSLMNEAQMLFHQHPVNARREAAGRPAINGLWTWGGGRWAGIDRPVDLGTIQAGIALARGLAAAAGIEASAPPPAPLGLDAPGTRLLIWDACQSAVSDADAMAWCEAAAALDDWLAPALLALRRGQLGELVIDTVDGGRYRVRPRDLGRFWRRAKPLAARILTAPSH